MLRVYIFLLVISLMSLARAESDKYSFRQFNWYDNLDKVKSVEDSNLLEEARGRDNTYKLIYREKIINLPVKLIYTFDPYCKKLIFARYEFNKTLGETKFDFLLNVMVDKYGEWIGNQERNPYDSYSWKTQDTRITVDRNVKNDDEEGSRPTN